MPVNLVIPEFLLPIQGIKYSAVACDIKKNGQLDLVAIEIVENSNVSAVFTKNKFCAAPVILAKNNLINADSIRYLLINSGNANAGTGEQGLNNAKYCCDSLAEKVGCHSNQILPFSTGVIGEALPVKKISNALPDLVKKLDPDNALSAAKGILTTDTALKAVSRQVEIDGELITITGFAKGSGMIKPNMATMLAYIFTDAKIDQNDLDELLSSATDQSFNAITVDGDTSTNDACVLVSTQQSQCHITQHNVEFKQTLNEVSRILAQNIVRDGEGATKFVTISVESSASYSDAKEIAFTIAHSPLVKTALFASDPNWGRILAAIGRAQIENLDISTVDLFLGNECLVLAGQPNSDYSEERAFAIMSKSEIEITVKLNCGDHSAQVWTTDLSYDYVKINAEYRS